MTSVLLCKPTAYLNQPQSPTVSVLQISNTTLKSLKLRTCKINRCLSQRHSQISSQQQDKFVEQSISLKMEAPLNIGIIGMGNFGQFLAKAFLRQGHNVLGTSRSDYSKYCQENGIQFFHELNGLCEAQPDVLIVCSSILSTDKVVRGIPFHKLHPNTIMVDVLSVKLFPKNLFMEVVPSGFGILCTHPMFGPVSGKNGWKGLRFQYEKVRITDQISDQDRKCDQFLGIFRNEECQMVEMSCEEHDSHAAESQFVTHTVARILSHMNMEATPIDTKGFETLRELTQNTVSDSSDLYDGLFLYNVNSAKQIQNLEKAFDNVKHDLFAKLRLSFKKQMDESASTERELVPSQSVQFLPSSGKVLQDVSSFAMMPEQGTKELLQAAN
ncbi:prephenate dehydrogenase (NADP(+)) [Ranunculus cassubicifolius]